MKGLVLSAMVFVSYCISAVLVSQLLRPRRHSGLFGCLAILWSVAYLGLYLASPRHLWILPDGWTAEPRWLDASAGLLALLLNIHSFVDFFFGFNGGFSTSLLLNLLRSSPAPLTTAELTDRYRGTSGFDKIIAWRLPALQRDRFLDFDSASGVCHLTPRGRFVAIVTRWLKRLLNLDRGG
jgi:hypothetical protein